MVHDLAFAELMNDDGLGYLSAGGPRLLRDHARLPMYIVTCCMCMVSSYRGLFNSTSASMASLTAVNLQLKSIHITTRKCYIADQMLRKASTVWLKRPVRNFVGVSDLKLNSYSQRDNVSSVIIIIIIIIIIIPNIFSLLHSLVQSRI